MLLARWREAVPSSTDEMLGCPSLVAIAPLLVLVDGRFVDRFLLRGPDGPCFVVVFGETKNLCDPAGRAAVARGAH